jgi:alpha-glucan,water dikinase
MEEWHQKLHNNTSPDDVVICQALIAMLQEGLDIQAYWRTLHVRCVNSE